MKCKACGQELAEGSRICPICKTEQKISFQKNEASEVSEEVINKGTTDLEKRYIETNPIEGGSTANHQTKNISKTQREEYPYEPRSRVVAGLLQIFLGGFGLGRFYLGYHKMALGQLFTSPIFFIGNIWAFIDGILILCGEITEDANGIPLK